MTWGLVFALPGREGHAPLGHRRWASRDDAVAACDREAATWADQGRDVTPLGEGRWKITRPEDPVNGYILAVREEVEAHV